MYYINGNEKQFVFSEDEKFLKKYTLSNFIYYKNFKFSDTKNYSSEKRLDLIKKIFSNQEIDLELKNKIIHCILCAKWYPVNNSYKYCCNCKYNPKY